MRHVAAKLVPRILTAKQEKWRLSVARNMQQEAESDENFHHGQRDVGLRV
jgi:hypothetical protein